MPDEERASEEACLCSSILEYLKEANLWLTLMIAQGYCSLVDNLCLLSGEQE